MSIDNGSLFLGLDSSTQGLKALVLSFNGVSQQLELTSTFTVNYDAELPHYGTLGGAHRDADGLSVTAPTLMWIEALDLLLAKMKAENLDFRKVRAISGSGQQHGSVYWNHAASKLLSGLQSSETLAKQLQDAFSVPNSPIWMDSSTTSICREMEQLFHGGAKDLADKTGSRAYERFTLSQITKVSQMTFVLISRFSILKLICEFFTFLDLTNEPDCVSQHFTNKFGFLIHGIALLWDCCSHRRW